MQQEPLKVAIVGAGHRSRAYAEYALKHPERMRVVAVADPDPLRRGKAVEQHGIPASMQFETYQQLAERPRLADAVINGTLDQHHYDSSLRLLERGYHMLLEKPIAPTEPEVRELTRLAQEKHRTVMICHVLRYSPFYAAVKRLLEADRIGEVIALRTREAVSYHHLSAGFVRGKWSRSDETAPILLAKCCHDLDLIAWMMAGTQPRRVASVGNLKQFRPENAPAEAGTRCLVDCPIEQDCVYSARKLYVTQPRWGFYAWDTIEHIDDPSEQDKLDSLKDPANPHGRCIWKTGSNQYDHQSVIIEFANGATATHDLFGATSRSVRTLEIVGTKGELEGDFERGTLVVRQHHPEDPKGYDEEDIDVNAVGGDGAGGHGGGDERLVEDFVSVMLGESASQAVTRIEDSLIGHLLVFAANRSVDERRMVDVHVDHEEALAASADPAGR